MSGRRPVIFSFEDTGDNLSLLPLAARRALDVAGYRLSLDGWQSLAFEDRRLLTAAGAEETVDLGIVERIVRRSEHPVTRIKPVADPDPGAPPEQLLALLGNRRSVDSGAWGRLRAFDRFVLVHVLRRSIAHEDPARLEEALAVVLADPDPAPRVEAVAPPEREPRPGTIPPAAAPSDRARPSSAPPRPRAARPPDVLADRVSSRPPPPIHPTRPSTQPPVIEAQYVPAPPRAPAVPGGLSTHLDDAGQVRMVDVGDKAVSHRRATATGSVRMRPETARAIGRHEAPKGEVLATARVAAILAAKRTSELIPLCHPVGLTKIEVHLDVEPAAGRVNVTAIAETHDRTGVEMEALTAVSVACLTIYDMLKGIDREMVVDGVRLLSKTGGKHGPYQRADEAP